MRAVIQYSCLAEPRHCLKQYEVGDVLGGMAVAVWALFLTGYGSGAFDRIGREIGSGLYDGSHKVP